MGQGFESLQACQYRGKLRAARLGALFPTRPGIIGFARGPFGSFQSAYGGYSSAGRAPDCGSGCRGFEPHYPPHTVAEGRSVRSGPRLTSTLGCSQVVRHGTLTPAFAGSSPAIPAKYDPVAQLVEQRPFKAKVRGSSPRWVTIGEPDELCNNLLVGAVFRSGSPSIN